MAGSAIGGRSDYTELDRAFFEKYCYNCHDADSEKGDLNLKALDRKISNATDAAHWQDILDQMNAGEMPPKKKAAFKTGVVSNHW